MKHLIMVATDHEFQTPGNSWEKLFSEMLRSIVAGYDIQIILEEWNDNRGRSIAGTLADTELQWANVGTPNTSEYDTSKCGHINFDPLRPVLTFQKYPFGIQEKRTVYGATDSGMHVSV